jgi:aspartyl-tRNA(Asn)/glutamyl-tRNA(Gln) amidotransferase subunit B
MSAYEMVVGLEVHVQLKTRTKAFCDSPTTFWAEPNVNTCPICLALPGALPVLNAHAVELAVRAALALGCTVHGVSIFARKNYFYPDLPKGYQISQYDRPLATGGRLSGVGITRVHMEEDAGKSIHDRYTGATAIDLNRAGVPLIEIVSEPDIRSAQEARRYLTTLKQVLEYADVSDVDMEKGSLRVDANVSARKRGETRLGTKTEVKNMNTFSGVEKALEAEFERQVALLESGGRVIQQTMLWDGAKGEVRPARSKEESHDYRYFPEPDLPPLVLTDEYIEGIRRSLPEMPEARRKRYSEQYGLTDQEIDELVANQPLAAYFEETTKSLGNPKAVANWVRGLSSPSFAIPPARLAELLAMVASGAISHTAAKTVFADMEKSGESAERVADRLGLRKVSDDGALEQWIAEVRTENPTEWARFQAGETKLQKVLVGLVMKKSKGKADPQRVNQLLAGGV